MKKQQLTIVLLLNLGLLFSARAQTVVSEFTDVQKIEQLSSDNEESMPFPYLDGTKMYFVRTVIVGSMKQRVKGQDIWSSEFNGTSWEEPSNLFEEGNDNGNNGVIGVSNDGNTLHLFNSIQTRRKLAKGIAVTERDAEGNWSELKEVTIPGFEVGEGLYSFYMTPNEKILLVGMSANDTSSQSDLFVSLKNAEGNWGELKTLGASINTTGMEITPFIDESGNTIFFSSDGHKGLGGMDIFTATRLDDSWSNWSTPINLGSPVNSDAFDAYFMFGNPEEAVFTSNRGGLFSDIYSAKLKQEELIAPKKETMFAQMYFKELPVEVVDLLIMDKDGMLIEKRTTDKDGKFSFVRLKDEPYTIQIDNEDTTLQENAKIYLVDESGRKLKRLALDEHGVYKNDLTNYDTDLVEGLFEYKGLPQENITLIVVDENGFPMDTIITDKDGKFTYRKSLNDENFSIKPLMNSENLLVENVEIFATDKSGEKLSSLIVNTNQNVENTTETVAAKVPELDQLSTNIQVAKDKTIVKPGADELASKSNVDESSINKKPKTNATTTPEEPMVKSSGKTIYFDFNERTLTADDKAILDQIITSLRSNPKSSVTMIGFTDNIGSVEVNVRVASARARAARAYLTENGISKSRITIYGYGEVMFKGDNRTEKGRALNRRVEIELN